VYLREEVVKWPKERGRLRQRLESARTTLRTLTQKYDDVVMKSISSPVLPVEPLVQQVQLQRGCICHSYLLISSGGCVNTMSCAVAQERTAQKHKDQTVKQQQLQEKELAKLTKMHTRTKAENSRVLLVCTPLSSSCAGNKCTVSPYKHSICTVRLCGCYWYVCAALVQRAKCTVHILCLYGDTVRGFGPARLCSFVAASTEFQLSSCSTGHGGAVQACNKRGARTRVRASRREARAGFAGYGDGRPNRGECTNPFHQAELRNCDRAFDTVCGGDI
jgi:hypothetical protein